MTNKYTVFWDKSALEDLLKLSKKEAQRIKKKVDNYLAQDPVHLGKPLAGQLKGCYRYRMGNYRVIYEVHKEQVSIIVVKVGHRSDVYHH